MMIMRGFICERNYVNVLNCRTSQHQHIYSSTIVYQRASLILQTENNYLPFMRHKKLNMLSMLVICYKWIQLYDVYAYIFIFSKQSFNEPL